MEIVPGEDVCWSFVKKGKGNNKIFKCLQTAKPSESVSVHLNVFRIKNLQHNRSFVVRHNVKCEQIVYGPGAEACVKCWRGGRGLSHRERRLFIIKGWNLRR